LSQSILSRKNNNLIREAEEAGKASRFNEESVRNELALQTSAAYFSLHQARKMAALAEESLATAERRKEIADELFRADRIRQVDVTLAGTAVSSARQQLLVAREEAMIAQAELQNYTGLAESVLIHTVEPAIENPAFDAASETLYAQALENSPDIRQAEADIRSKEFHLEAEKGERFPKINIVGEYALFSRENNYEDYFNRFERNNYLIGLSVQVPLFDGFRSSSRVAQSRLELAEARHRLERAKSDLKLAVQRGLSSLRIAGGANALARDEAEAARQSLQVSEALLQSGRISRGDLEDARTRLLQKEYQQLDSERALFQRKLELLSVVGNISSVFQP
jgi:outer membrane protein